MQPVKDIILNSGKNIHWRIRQTFNYPLFPTIQKLFVIYDFSNFEKFDK